MNVFRPIGLTGLLLPVLLAGLLCAAASTAASAAAQDEPAGSAPSAEPAPAPSPGGVDSTYQLGPGDKVQINVFNQADLSGEYTLDGDGRFSMPLIGTVEANGLTPLELEALLVGRFKPDYLVNPRIFIQVGNYRPYYLMGEVAATGAFPYQPGLTYLTAIANAGGYTYRAKQDVVYVIRGDDPTQTEIKLSVEEKVQPGDIIRVAERLF
jgi:polysaccharide export outer membrane protein